MVSHLCAVVVWPKKLKNMTWKQITNLCRKALLLLAKFWILRTWPPFSVFGLCTAAGIQTSHATAVIYLLHLFVSMKSNDADISWYFIASPQSKPAICSNSEINVISTRETQTNGTKAFAKQLLQRQSKLAWKSNNLEHVYFMFINLCSFSYMFVTSSIPNNVEHPNAFGNIKQGRWNSTRCATSASQRP